MTTIKSVSYDQIEIIKSIMDLCGIERFDIDSTYGNGKFWNDENKPARRFDVDESLSDVENYSSCCLPVVDCSVSSFMFDPPFLTYVKNGRDHGSIISRRFGGYWTYRELEDHYKGTIKEAGRVLKRKGIFVIKCQDIIHNHKMHCTHVNVINWANELFRLKDLFVLPAKHRMGIPEQAGMKKKQQKHARIYHSYFLVFEKL